jgi:hypothetical protein
MNIAWRVMRREGPQMLSRMNLRITTAKDAVVVMFAGRGDDTSTFHRVQNHWMSGVFVL